MEMFLNYLGETLFGVGIIAVCVFAGIAWYLKRLTSGLQKLEQS